MASYKINEDLLVGNTGKTLKRMSDILTEFEIFHNIHRTRYVYNGTGAEGRYELFRICSTGGWAGRTITFQVQIYNSCWYAMGLVSYYNNATPQGRYIFKSNNLELFLGKNSDNTVSVYLAVYYQYSPVMLTIIANSNSYDDVYGTEFPKSLGSLPSGLTAFSNF